MFKYILALSLVFIFATEAEAQAITQTWIDPCTGDVQTATFVVGMGAITIMYRGQAQAFTKQDFIDGTLMSWVMETTATIPCPVNPVVTATVNAAAQAAARAAAEAAARAAAQAAAQAAAAAAAELLGPDNPEVDLPPLDRVAADNRELVLAYHPDLAGLARAWCKER